MFKFFKILKCIPRICIICLEIFCNLQNTTAHLQISYTSWSFALISKKGSRRYCMFRDNSLHVNPTARTCLNSKFVYIHTSIHASRHNSFRVIYCVCAAIIGLTNTTLKLHTLTRYGAVRAKVWCVGIQQGFPLLWNDENFLRCVFPYIVQQHNHACRDQVNAAYC